MNFLLCSTMFPNSCLSARALSAMSVFIIMAMSYRWRDILSTRTSATSLLNSSCRRQTFSRKVLSGLTVGTLNFASANCVLGKASSIIERSWTFSRGSLILRPLTSILTAFLIYESMGYSESYLTLITSGSTVDIEVMFTSMLNLSDGMPCSIILSRRSF